MSLNLEKKYHDNLISHQAERIKGYASLFNVTDQQGDQVAKGAFANSLAKRNPHNVKMLWQHDPTKPIGVWDVLREDKKGLYVEGVILTEIEAGREALALLRAGAVKGLSIGYRTLVSGKSNQTGRILKSVDLWEISLVTFPMLPEAEAMIDERTDQIRTYSEFHEASLSLRNLINEE